MQDYSEERSGKSSGIAINKKLRLSDEIEYASLDVAWSSNWSPSPQRRQGTGGNGRPQHSPPLSQYSGGYPGVAHHSSRGMPWMALGTQGFLGLKATPSHTQMGISIEPPSFSVEAMFDWRAHGRERGGVDVTPP
mgnify:CR=1 FL=1